MAEHYSRMAGTLRFWKSKAAAYQRLHTARVGWSLVAGAALPVLVQYQGLRQQESDFYDCTRDLLDNASDDPKELKKQVDSYIEMVNRIRKVGRRVETSSPPSAL
ncbi:hypothetical protein [Paractinoplanes rishiriensis]|uniref:Uncharacterized protein n=1 Tax=Paractinoplanes rishiriensis TaxID=1050105 RepID=A0A919JVD6_9ACTN|nr:hypothetical protein [Actinoplanes rishiriensis]GIE95535.1 hypothetical protein Ari01nite_30000 [Actinoplanes rishiriensis]